MNIADLFKYEELNGKKYLVYEKQADDTLDKTTLSMLSNNEIEGIARFSSIMMDQNVIMRYNITDLIPMNDIFSAPVKKQKLLSLLESIANTMICGDDYLLNMTSFVLDERFIYVNPENLKVFMIVLPVYREGERIELFLKKLLFDVQYDQTEDCSYVASLMNLLGNDNKFAIRSFRDEIAKFKKNTLSKHVVPKDKTEDLISKKQDEPGRDKSDNMSAAAISGNVSAVMEHSQHTPEKEENIRILFEQEEEPKKKGFFLKKEKKDKKEKKHFWEKKKEKTTESDENEEFPEKSPFGGIAIPGMDLIGKIQAERKETESPLNQSEVSRQPIPIPVQHVEMTQKDVQHEDFGETVYVDEDSEAPTEFEDINNPGQKYVLYRCSTQETFEIKGDVVRVGRSPSISEICITGNRGVGRIHAVLYVRDGQVYILDNNSKNKTFVDGKELKPDQPVMLLSGSKIRLGTEELEFRISR